MRSWRSSACLTAHEDDALRAVRAAAEMRDALPELGLQARIGLNTGMVVTGTEERLATVNAHADTYADLGEVLRLAGRREEATEALRQALARYEAKKNVVVAGRMRERLASLRTEVG